MEQERATLEPHCEWRLSTSGECLCTRKTVISHEKSRKGGRG